MLILNNIINYFRNVFNKKSLNQHSEVTIIVTDSSQDLKPLDHTEIVIKKINNNVKALIVTTNEVFNNQFKPIERFSMV